MIDHVAATVAYFASTSLLSHGMPFYSASPRVSGSHRSASHRRTFRRILTRRPFSYLKLSGRRMSKGGLSFRRLKSDARTSLPWFSLWACSTSWNHTSKFAPADESLLIPATYSTCQGRVFGCTCSRHQHHDARPNFLAMEGNTLSALRPLIISISSVLKFPPGSID